MKRREFITIVGGTAAWSLGARAQLAGTTRRAAFLAGASTPGGKALVECFRAGMRELGWNEGGNINIEYEWSEGVTGRYESLAAEIVTRRPDLIVVTSTPGTKAIQRGTREIPVVFIGVSDPVASGSVDRLARPSGNITGISNILPATTGKLLHEVFRISGEWPYPYRQNVLLEDVVEGVGFVEWDHFVTEYPRFADARLEFAERLVRAVTPTVEGTSEGGGAVLP